MISNLFLAALITSGSLLGQWRYDGFIYEGKRYPLPNPNLHLTFTFSSEQKVRLFWMRDDEDGFCERDADYELRGDKLYQKVTWVNPKNAPVCQQDPDMRLGNETINGVRLLEDELFLLFEINGKEFDYILKREI